MGLLIRLTKKAAIAAFYIGWPQWLIGEVLFKVLDDVI
ncbi:hypothetical protein GMA8713_01461 [Grimontia marina]|uniref:Uncharacterized protein n=1 Tax=Grimontia marina TaxID=646534 RepID=A0A128F271_9GAMM|nr:hypothetical protein GMA8713_01461 [Grimontia marina]